MKQVLAIAVLAAACTVDLPPPQPTGVDPVWGYNGEDTLVTIAGQHFFPQVEVDATGGSEAQVNDRFAVALLRDAVTAELPAVSLEDTRHLQAVVPAGLEPGLYDVRVTGPTGGEGILEDAFTVSDTRADRILVDSDSVVFEVFETAWVEITLVDPDDERVLADLPVVIVVSVDEGAIAADFEDGGLEDQQPFATGFGIRGRLGEDGYALVGLTVDTPNTVDVIVSPGPEGSGVAEGLLKLLFEPGSELELDIALPDDPFTTSAGTPFFADLTLLDQFGNEVEGQSEIVLLKNACETWVDAVQINGSTSVEVTLREATGTAGCPSDRILSVSGPPGQSAEITVDPGPISEFEVVTTPDQVVAGEQDLNALITPVDAWGNRVVWGGSNLTLTDSVGGVGSTECVVGSTVFCTVQSLVAAPDIALSVEDDAGVTGMSDLYTVVPADPDVVDVVVDGPAEAGSPVAVTVTVRDAYGNVIDDVAASDLSFAAAGDAPDCTPVTPAGDGSLPFDCVLSVARTDAVLEATYVEAPLVGQSAAFVVANGPLSVVQVAPASNAVTAGDPVQVTFTGRDAWGNAYTVQADPVVDVRDTGGTFSLAQVTLDAAGVATDSGTFTLAGSTAVVASQGISDLGQSASISVAAAGPDAIAVDAGAPWVWVGAGVVADVQVVDAYGNRADWSGMVTLTAQSGNAPPADATLSAGAGVATLTWSAPALTEVLDGAAGGGLSGGSPVFAVVEDCGDPDPTAAVSFSGFPEAILCQDPGSGEAVLSADLGASTMGDFPLGWFAVRADGRWASSSSDPDLALTLDEAGRYTVTALVAGTDGCADAVAAEAWVGPDDGEPVGPIVLEPAAATIDVASGSTVVAVEGVTDCSRDLAAGGQVFLWTDRGALQGAAPTGAGLAVVLDAAGDAAVTLDATNAETGGLGTVTAWVPTGAAGGQATVILLGDDRRPTVWDQDPWGDTVGALDTVVLSFSEPLLASDVTTARFAVTGPVVTDVIDAALDPAGDVVTLILDPPLLAESGTWTVIAARDLRDLQGNKLDGLWTGESDDHVGTFGDLPPGADPVSACTPDTPVFRPDGDDGPGPESDAVVFSIGSNTAPAWWVIGVQDAADTLVRVERVVPAGALDSWTWDGRDTDGRVVDNGAWTVTVEADDGFGNTGGGCTAVVTVDNASGGG